MNWPSWVLVENAHVFPQIFWAVKFRFSWSVIPGPWFNIKMSSYQYRKSHCGYNTILRPSYLHNGIAYTGKTASSYWIRTQLFVCWMHINRYALPSGIEYPFSGCVTEYIPKYKIWPTTFSMRHSCDIYLYKCILVKQITKIYIW